jgi:hypothetical protein
MLFPLHFQIAQNVKVSPSANINAGMIVGAVPDTDTTQAAIAAATDNESTESSRIRPIGIAGDTTDLRNINFGGATSKGYAAQIVINGNGDTTQSQDRISDLFQETLASSLMTVYSGSFVGLTDQVLASDSFVPGGPVYLGTGDNAGLLTITPGGAAIRLGIALSTVTDWPNGVPGVDINSSMTLGSFLKVSLNI